MTTNSDILASNWKQLRSKLKQQWMALTDDDLTTIDGSAEVLIELLQEKYGYSQPRAADEVNNFLREVEGQLAA
jgi:uncharacterized protein YjbJ (UPF0337 family)